MSTAVDLQVRLDSNHLLTRSSRALARWAMNIPQVHCFESDCCIDYHIMIYESYISYNMMALKIIIIAMDKDRFRDHLFYQDCKRVDSASSRPWISQSTRCRLACYSVPWLFTGILTRNVQWHTINKFLGSWCISKFGTSRSNLRWELTGERVLPTIIIAVLSY